MPFIHNYNLVFIHIPKNGGSSVENHFGLWKHNNDQFSCNDKKKKIAWVSLNEEPVDIPGHVLSQNYGTGDFLFSVQHYIPYLARKLDRENWDKYKKFTIIRDPYTRAISEYCYRHHGEKLTRFNNERFKTWFLGFCKTGYILDHYLPQVEYFNYIDYDYVLRFENLQDEFKNMCEELKIKEKELPHINKSAGNVPAFKKELSKENIDLINERYYKDFEKFDYKFL